jgi:hypothetical protein
VGGDDGVKIKLLFIIFYHITGYVLFPCSSREPWFLVGASLRVSTSSLDAWKWKIKFVNPPVSHL